MKKKILSVLLTCAMLFSSVCLFAVNLMAEASDKVTTIASYEDLEAFIASLATNDYAGETVSITANITANADFNAKAESVTAPAKVLDTTAAGVFKGTLEGNGNTVAGLYINGNALLPSASGVTVQNLTMDNCYVNSSSTVGILIGTHAGGTATFTNVTVSNSVTAYSNATINAGVFIATTTAGASNNISFTDCESLGNYISGGAKTTLLGGFIGNDAGNNITFLRCENSSEVHGMPTEEAYYNGGYKIGGFIGVTPNTADYKITLTDCINSGDITSFTIAGGLIGHLRCAVEIDRCLNTGVITSSSLMKGTTKYDSNAGGLIGKFENDQSKTAVISDSANMGEIVGTSTGSGKGNAGGLMGFAKNPVYVTDFLNSAAVTGFYKAGGMIGDSRVAVGKFERVLTTGVIKGYNGGKNVNSGASCAVFGTYAVTNGTNEVEFIDFYYYNTNANVFGIWQELGTLYNNHKVSYTAKNATFDYVPGTTNVADNVPDDYVDGDKSNTKGENLAIFNHFFKKYGYISDVTAAQGVKAANTLEAFAISEKWFLTENEPVPAGAFALMEKKSADTTATITYKGYQMNLTDTTSFNIRVVAGVDSTAFSKVGYELYLIEAGKQVLAENVNTDTVYTAINAYESATGELKDPITAESLESAYLSAIAVEDIPMTGAFTLVIKPYTVSADETVTLYGSACVLVIENGAVVQHYVA